MSGAARVRQQFAQGGIDAVLNRKQRARPPVPPIFDGEKEAKLIVLACSQPPEGRAKWTLRLLESKVVELNIVDHASDNTIGRVLKNAQAPSRAAMGHSAASKPCIRELQWRMFFPPRDEDCPLVCFDEASKQLLADTRSPIPARNLETAPPS